MSKASPIAAKRLTEPSLDGGGIKAVMEVYGDWEDQMGETDCPEGCVVEPDGCCSHGWLSAGRTAGVI